MKQNKYFAAALIAGGLIITSCEKAAVKDGDKPSDPTTTKEPAAPVSQLEEGKRVFSGLSSGLEKAVTALESVTDEASAKQAAETIKAVSAELNALKPKAAEVKALLTEEEAKQLETHAMESMQPLMGRMTVVMQKVMADAKTGDLLAPVMEDLRKAMAPPRAVEPPSHAE